MQIGLRLAATTLALAAVFSAGCATKSVQGQWSDREFANHSLHGAKVLVICDSSEAAVKRICEEQMRAELAGAGIMPVSMPGDASGQGAISDRGVGAARNADAKAVLLATVAPEVTSISPGPSVGIGVGGFGG